MIDDQVLKLWTSRVRSILGIVRAGETEHREVATMGAQVQADYHGRFIVELLQNASDQAAAAGKEASTVTIIRTSDIFALANEGLPFNEAGLRSITSLGLSTKNPQDAIGNKGIGFKSVFQVSATPEIYSSQSQADQYSVNAGLMFALSLTPFADSAYAAILRSLVEGVLAESPRGGPELTLEDAIAEVRAAAPFKFPLPLTMDHLGDRLRQIAASIHGQTLVVLPLRQAAGVTEVVDTAIAEIADTNGAALLFLPSVSTIHIVDRVRGREWCLKRHVVDPCKRIEGIGFIQTVRTSTKTTSTVCDRFWRVIVRRVGTPDVVPAEDAAREARTLNQYTRTFPGRNWARVDSSPVGVALPIPDPAAATPSVPSGPDGRICIGLPTRDPTGTPAWINAHFYGTISRTGIDLSDNLYNTTLFDETVRLHEALVTDLKASADLPTRRAATLAFQRVTGRLADRLYQPGNQASGPIVLSSDGHSFQAPSATLLPTLTDLEALILMAGTQGDLAHFRLPIPEAELTRTARSLLLTLVGGEPSAESLSVALLNRQGQSDSILEQAANKHRLKGPAFWEPFLAWAIKRFGTDGLRGHRILPVASTALETSAARVFLPPARRDNALAQSADDGELFEIPTDLAQSLKFLDERALALRKPSSRDLTPLAALLAPDVGPALVRRPRLHNLVNEAVGPLMQSLGMDEESRQNGIRLLRQAVRWLWVLSESGRARLAKDALRVPASAPDGHWAWIPPSSAYFGSGWLDEPVDTLLRAAYGDGMHRRLVSWPDFSAALGIETEERNAWVGALEFLGVSRSPKMLRPVPGSRAAPLSSRRWNSELSIEAGVPCPIPAAEQFWNPYLEAVRKRGARTSSGQGFDFRSVTWIEGLEREASRGPIVELMLHQHPVYEAEMETFLERQSRPNDDSTTVPSLWIHAITANDWPVIPTQHRRVPPSEAWLIDNQRKGRRRLALLQQVPEPYDQAIGLLKRLGVTPPQQASASRILQALDRLGRSCGQYDPETKSIALALAEDLFGCLQSVHARSEAVLPDIKPLCLPLERRKQAVGVPAATFTTAYINDDPVRAGFIPGFEDAYVWPLQPRQAKRELVTELRRQLGDAAVIYTSEAGIESRFVQDSSSQPEPLLEWLAREFPQHHVATDIACLIAYMGRLETDPEGEEFRRTWGLFQRTRLAFGTFPPDSPEPCFFDRASNVHQVSARLSKSEKLESTWMLVGLSFRDTWAAYARELEKGTPAKFLADRHITQVQRENIEIAIGLSSADRFKHLKAFAFSVWASRRDNPEVSIFEAEWPLNARSVHGMCEWLGCPQMAAEIATAACASEEAGSLALLRAAGIDTQQWQDARRILNLQPWQFTERITQWRNYHAALVAILKTRAARSLTTSLSEVEGMLRASAVSSPPAAITSSLSDSDAVLFRFLKEAQAELDRQTHVAGIDLLRRVLLSIIESNPKTLDTVDLDEVPNREMRVYRDDDEDKRTRDAKARLDGLILVATPLAAHNGETIDSATIRNDSRVQALSIGWWANCFTIMLAVQRLLQNQAPLTAQRMSEQRIFRDPAPANEMLQRFPELALASRGPEPAPVRQITVFGQPRPEDAVHSDLLLGSTGETGRRLKDLAAVHPECFANSRRQRLPIVSPAPRTPARGPGRGRPGAYHELRRDQELSGLLGEAFIFELFRRVLPDFDERAWCSENRHRYGLEGEGADSLGYDMQYRDSAGILTGRQDVPLCFIEVKASSGDAREAFPISANEWEKARACHHNGTEVYLIIRVAAVRDLPRIADVILDPFGLYTEQKVALTTNDMWVYVGAPVDEVVNDIGSPLSRCQYPPLPGNGLTAF